MRGCLGERALDHSRQPSSPQWVAETERDDPKTVVSGKRYPKHRKRSTKEVVKTCRKRLTEGLHSVIPSGRGAD